MGIQGQFITSAEYWVVLRTFCVKLNHPPWTKKIWIASSRFSCLLRTSCQCLSSCLLRTSGKCTSSCLLLTSAQSVSSGLSRRSGQCVLSCLLRTSDQCESSCLLRTSGQCVSTCLLRTSDQCDVRPVCIILPVKRARPVCIILPIRNFRPVWIILPVTNFRPLSIILTVTNSDQCVSRKHRTMPVFRKLLESKNIYHMWYCLLNLYIFYENRLSTSVAMTSEYFQQCENIIFSVPGKVHVWFRWNLANSDSNENVSKRMGTPSKISSLHNAWRIHTNLAEKSGK